MKHFIILGRTSRAIAEDVLLRYGKPAPTENGPIIAEPGNVFQAQMGTFEGGESVFRLFVRGKLEDHPIEQRLSESDMATIKKDLDGASVTIVHSISGDNTTSRAMSLLHAARYLKASCGVQNITLIAPHLPYLRNDRDFEMQNPLSGETVPEYNAVSCEAYAWELKVHGIDRVIGFEPHSRDSVNIYEKQFGRNVQFVKMGAFFASDIASTEEVVDINGDWRIAVGAPDGLNKPQDYGIARAKSFGLELYKGTEYGNYQQHINLEKIPFMFGIHKQRISPTESRIMRFHGDVEGKLAVLADDIISTGGTTNNGAKVLMEHGAAKVFAVATHAVLTRDGLPKILNSDDIARVYLADTIPGAYEKAGKAGFLSHPKLQIKTVAPIVIDLIEQDHRRNRRLVWAYSLTENSYKPAAGLTPQFG